MPGPIVFTGDQLTLRTVRSDDEAFLRRHWNDPDLRRWFGKARPTDAERLSALLDADDTIPFVPCREGDPVGFVWLFDIDNVAGRGELGYWITPAEREQGYATAAAALAVQYAFRERRFHKVVARVFDGNTPSRRVLETLGFEQEGVFRDHYFLEGEYVDAFLYGLLAEERC